MVEVVTVNIAMLSKVKRFIILLPCLVYLGCTITPPEKPINASTSLRNLKAKDPKSAEFNAFLATYGYKQEALPLSYWDIDNLTLCALFFHSKLEVAKQKLSLANLKVKTAEIRQSPTLNADIARSNQANGDLRPWSYGLSIGIPIQTNNKRELNVEKTNIHVDLARIDVAEVAWQLRSQIAADLIIYHQTLAELKLLQEELEILNSIAAMLKKRLEAGIISRTEFNNASLFTLKKKHEFNTKQEGLNLIKAKLASDVGLTPEQLATIKIKPLLLDKTLSQQKKVLSRVLESKTLQQEALLNRNDLRRSLLKYAAAETEIKLQAAKQIPDIILSPGFLFEFGDKIWSLGFSSLFTALNKHTVLIEEAKQLREIEGAAFEQLQAEIVASANQQKARYLSAKQITDQAHQEVNSQKMILARMQQQFDAGLIGKLDLSRHKHNVFVAEQQLLSSQFKLLEAAKQIEDLMQKPLYNSFKMPSLTNNES